MKRIFLYLALILVGMPSILSAQATDTLPPSLSSFEFTPNPIDLTSGPANLGITLFVTDDLSGVNFVSPVNYPGPGVVFRSPSGSQVVTTLYGAFSLVPGGGDNFAGTWHGEATFPQWAESGTWTVESVTLEDNVGNNIRIDSAALGAAGFPTTLEVLSNSDTTPPELVGLTISPTTVDTSIDYVYATVTLDLTDDVSGTDFSYRPDLPYVMGFQPSIGNFVRLCSDPVLESGTPLVGTWTSQCLFPKYSQAGNWTISLYIRDAAGNVKPILTSDLQTLGLPTGLTLTSTPSDISPVHISTFTFSPNFIDTSAGSQIVTATANVTDDISGFSAIQASFVSPSGGQRRTILIYNKLSGDQLHGQFNGTVEFPQFSEAGTWQLQNLFYYDVVFNYVSIDTNAIKAQGFPTVLNVVLPSLVEDDQIGTGGGTVVDDVFGNRAQVTFPAGLVNQVTTVAIDVLESTLTFPMPTGFAAPGSRFVNIKLTPEPPMPFAPPGATIVLPLVSPMPVGTHLTLYRVDPGTGTLVPDLSVSGGPVVGTVDAGGLSATFTGVSHLSVVVGLISDLVAPVVTPPANITLMATEALGARGSASASLATFLAAGTAVDNMDPAPVRLAARVAGSDVTSATLFALGTTKVTFRFKDIAGNIGSATANVTVVAPITNLAARGKLTQVELSWTARTGVHHQNIYRGTVSGGPYVKIAEVPATSGAYFDTGLVLGNTYYYVVGQVIANGTELSRSNQATIKLTGR